MADEDYKFPDEIEVTNGSDDLEIEITDDTPPEDRGRSPLPRNVVEELENDDLEEYSDKVKKRLGQMKKVWHDERREKERAHREREEALQFMYAAYKALRELGDKLDPQTRQELETQMTAARAALTSSDVETLRSTTSALHAAVQRLGAVAYQAAGSAPAGPAAANTTDGDVIDGDYREA